MNNFDLILRNVTQRKVRTGLTVFGIALGIFAIMVMGGMSEYLDRHANRGLELMSDKIYIVPESGFFGGSLEDSMVSKVRHVPGVYDAYGLLYLPYDMDSLGLFGAFVVGLAPEKQELTLKNVKLTQGRMLVPGDRYSAVVGSNVARQYNLNVGDELVVKSKRVVKAQTITNARNFTIVGVLEFTSSDFDYVIAVPLDIAKKFYEMDNKLTYIWAIPEQNVDAEDLSRRIELGVDNITTISPMELRKQSEQLLLVMNLITISAAVLAAIIGGLSVMNTMLMSVSERTREFGLMKAMGAEVSDILLLTMGESALMGILGGILGILGGSIFIYFMNEYLATMGTVLFAVTFRLIVISIVFATFLGTLSGILPAYRAAKMRPMEAMKYG